MVKHSRTGKEEKREGFYRKGRGRWGRVSWMPGIGQERTGRTDMYIYGMDGKCEVEKMRFGG